MLNKDFNNIINSLVPISRFNKGEANKIFDEVKKTGFKIVLKNNTPACVLLTLEKYEKMLEIIEDYNLLVEAENRMSKAKPGDFMPMDKVMKKLGINKLEIADFDSENED